MATPYLGEIRIVSFPFAPKSWAFCDGQLLSKDQNTQLFDLIGTTYGGDGVNNFALPNLSGRLPIHSGQGPGLTTRVLGALGGSEAVALTLVQIPSHSHALVGSTSDATSASPTDLFPAASPSKALYGAATSPVVTTSTAVTTTAAAAHDNRMPSLALYFVISLQGIPPSLGT